MEHTSRYHKERRFKTVQQVPLNSDDRASPSSMFSADTSMHLPARICYIMLMSVSAPHTCLSMHPTLILMSSYNSLLMVVARFVSSSLAHTHSSSSCHPGGSIVH